MLVDRIELNQINLKYFITYLIINHLPWSLVPHLITLLLTHIYNLKYLCYHLDFNRGHDTYLIGLFRFSPFSDVLQ